MMERGRREGSEGRNMRKREEGRGGRAKEVGNERKRGSLPPRLLGLNGEFNCIKLRS
jgi:hypothetical protein